MRMTRTLSAAIYAVAAMVSVFPVPGARAQALFGIRIGADVAEIKNPAPSLPIATNSYGRYTVMKWKMPDGNELSVTFVTRTGKVVYVEHDWKGNPRSDATEYEGLYFGKSSRGDIKAMMGNSGISIGGRGTGVPVGKRLAIFNSYAVDGRDGPADVIATFVTMLDTDGLGGGTGAIDKRARLDAVILADHGYLKETWGRAETYDPNYRPIPWRARGEVSSARPGAGADKGR